MLGALTLLTLGRWRWPGRRQVPGLLAMGLGLAVGYPLFFAGRVGHHVKMVDQSCRLEEPSKLVLRP